MTTRTHGDDSQGGGAHPDRLWGVHDLADYLDIPVQTIYQWRKRGYGPPGRRMGKHVRYRPGEVERWINSLSDRIA